MVFSNKKYRVNFIIASAVFFIVLAVYLFTLVPTIYIEDNPELITAAVSLGIPHPSGYPLFVLLGKLFSFIPLGTIPWRLNFMSAFFSALTVSFLYLILERITKRRLLSFGTSLILPFSPMFWSQSLDAEVYTLNIFFVALIIYLLIVWSETKKNKILYWISFIYGLSLTNHQMILLLFPAFALFIYLNDKNIIKRFRLVFILAIFFLLGLSVYLYLPIRAHQNPVLNWGDPETLKRFWDHVTRKEYGDFSIIQKSSKIGLIIFFFINIIYDFFWPIILLSFSGLAYLSFKKRKIAILTFGVFFLNSFGIILLRNAGYNQEMEYVFRPYYLPCYFIVIVWLGIIFNYFFDLILKIRDRVRPVLFQTLRAVFFVVVLSLPISFLITNYQNRDRSDFWMSHDYIKAIFDSMEPQAIYLFITNNDAISDTEIFGIFYFKIVENYRPDVSIIEERNFLRRGVLIQTPLNHYTKIHMKRKEGLLRAAWQAAEKYNRPLYTNFVVNSNTVRDLGLYSRSNGLINKVFANKTEAQKAEMKYSDSVIRNLDQENLINEYIPSSLMSFYNLNQAYYFIENGDFGASEEHLLKSKDYNPRVFYPLYDDFVKHREEWLQDDD